MGTYSYSLSDQAEAPGFGNDSNDDEVNSPTPPTGMQYDFTDPSEYGAPLVCYCGEDVVLESATRVPNQGRLYYTCPNRNDGGCHVWKWWDMAVIEEMKNVREQTESALIQEVNRVEQVEALKDQVLQSQADMADLQKKMNVLCFVIVAAIVSFLAVYLVN